MRSSIEIQPGGVPLGQFPDGFDPASMLAIRAVAAYPQSGMGKSAVILADYALRGFEDPSRVGIPELARLNPDGERCAATINAVHEHFGIPHISSPQAAGFLRLLASHALATILTESTNQASGLGRPWLGELPRSISGWQEGPSPIIDIAAAYQLHGYLSREVKVRQGVQAALRPRVQRLRSMTRERQQTLAADVRTRRKLPRSNP